MHSVIQIILIAIFSKLLLVECKPYFSKRDPVLVNNLENLDERAGNEVQYDDYPLVVSKRAAMLLDRLMVALHHALEDEDGNPRKINEVYRDGSFYATSQTLGNKGDPGLAEDAEGMEGGISPSQIAVGGAELLLNDPANVRNSNKHNNKNKNNNSPPQGVDETMGLQRRGHETLGPNKGRVYWRCYFNAVTCF